MCESEQALAELQKLHTQLGNDYLHLELTVRQLRGEVERLRGGAGGS